MLEASLIITKLVKIRVTIWCEICIVPTHSILLLDGALLGVEGVGDWVAGARLETALIRKGSILLDLGAWVHIGDILSLIGVRCGL